MIMYRKYMYFRNHHYMRKFTREYLSYIYSKYCLKAYLNLLSKYKIISIINIDLVILKNWELATKIIFCFIKANQIFN